LLQNLIKKSKFKGFERGSRIGDSEEAGQKLKQEE